MVEQQFECPFFVSPRQLTQPYNQILDEAKKQEVDDVVIHNAIGDLNPTLENLYSTSYGKQYLSYRRKVTVGIIGV